MIPAPGRKLSHYQLIERIGQGGMGVVWKANDSTLGRNAAIKILPDSLAIDPERIARFEREARVLAALNHPHIASIFGFHEFEGVRFLAMELVEGDDLSQRLERGPIPLPEALPLALQITEALEHAHDKGIIHRDLKPGNVKLTAGGQAKVLDFGLAKALEGDPSRSGSSSSMSRSPTITEHLTEPNVLLGTASYMSPEQARGHSADRRADIWAFGVLLMEMLTGKRVFEGETISDTLASVLKSDPDWSLLPKEIPERIRSLLHRCLERNPRQRLRDIGEARIQIEQAIAGGPDAAAQPSLPAASRGLSWWVAAGAVLLGALAMLLISRATQTPPRAAQVRKFRLSVPGEAATPQSPAISPDGRAVAYVARGSLWIQDLNELEPREVRTEGTPSYLFWSPDGRNVAYVTGDRIMRVGVDGSGSQSICNLGGEITSGGGGASWSADGTIFFSRGDSGGVFQVPGIGGDPRPLFRPDSTESDCHEPFALPGGRGILFGSHRLDGGIDNITLWTAGRRKVLIEIPDQRIVNPVYDPAGFILFERGPAPTPGIWAVPFSLSRLQTTGEPFLVAPGTNPTVSSDGTLTHLPVGSTGAQQLAWWSREGKELELLTRADHGEEVLSLAPDERRVAWPLTLNGNTDLWIMDIARGTRSRLTFDAGEDDAPSWSPSGDRIAYNILPKGSPPPDGFRVMLRAADGTGTADTIVAGVAPNFTPDGKSLIYVAPTGNAWRLMEFPLGGGESRELLKGHPFVVDGQVSPSAGFLAYMSNESGHWEVYLTRYPSCEGRWQVSTEGGQWPRWNGAGDRLFFAQADEIMEVEVSGTSAPSLSVPKRLFSRPSVGTGIFGFHVSFEVTRDGNRFLLIRPAGHEGPTPGVALVENWSAEFAREK